MLRILILLLFASIPLSSLPQNRGNHEAHAFNELNIVDSGLFPILDTIIQMKNDSESFKYATLFPIEFGRDKLRADMIIIRARGVRLYYNDPEILGYFNHDRHTFIVKGDSLNTDIFQLSTRQRIFNFSLDSMSYIDINGDYVISDIYALSDMFAVWSVRYTEGTFKLLSFFTDNKKDKWFSIIKKEYKELQITPEEDDIQFDESND